MRQNKTVIAPSREVRVGVCCGWAIRGTFRRGVGWPSLYRQSMQHSSSVVAVQPVAPLAPHAPSSTHLLPDVVLSLCPLVQADTLARFCTSVHMLEGVLLLLLRCFKYVTNF